MKREPHFDDLRSEYMPDISLSLSVWTAENQRDRKTRTELTELSCQPDSDRPGPDLPGTGQSGFADFDVTERIYGYRYVPSAANERIWPYQRSA